MADHKAMFDAPAEVYDRFVGRYSPGLAQGMCDAAGVRRGQRALDVGCGSGALLLALAVIVGAENVVGVDPSEPFLKAAQAKVPGARTVVGSAEALPFAKGEFDATLAQLVINFLEDPAAGVAEMARVTRAGGVVAACVWDYSGGMTLLRTFWEAALAVEPDGARARMEHQMPFARPEELGELWQSSLEDVTVSPIEVPASYEDFDDLWTPFLGGVGPAASYAASLEPEPQSRLRDAFFRQLGSPDGAFTLSARAWCAVGVVGT
jgi:ubiquinone/menaquinone biosynthesis C-methylase UbiE